MKKINKYFLYIYLPLFVILVNLLFANPSLLNADAVIYDNILNNYSKINNEIDSSIWDGSVDTSFSGNGTSNNPYVISNASEFAGFAQKVNDGYNCAGQYFDLTTDINWNNQSYRPIGTTDIYEYRAHNNQDNYFSGIFNGNSHTISNLNVDYNDYSNSVQGYLISIMIEPNYGGVFGRVMGTASSYAEVHSLNVVNSTISVSSRGLLDGEGNAYAGGIAGYSKYARIYNCSTDNSITASTQHYPRPTQQGGRVLISFAYAGGIVGFAEYSYISYCRNLGSVSAYIIPQENGQIGWPQTFIDGLFVAGDSATLISAYTFYANKGKLISKTGNVYELINVNQLTGAWLINNKEIIYWLNDGR